MTGGGRGWQKVAEVSVDAGRRWRRLVELSRWQRIGRRWQRAGGRWQRLAEL